MRGRGDLDAVLGRAKQLVCPHCRCAGMVVGHGLLMGYAERSGDREVRGRRLLCSDRHRRRGCGRTFSVLLATVIAGFVVRAPTLSGFLAAVVAGACRKAAWEQGGAAGLSLRSGYRLWARVVASQPHIRTALCGVGPPPASTDARPIAQLLAHLREAVGGAGCVVAGFQLTLQRGVFA